MITTEQISQLPQYQALIKARHKIVWLLSALVVVVYFAFILTIAFNPGILGQPIGQGVTSIGVVVGFAVILFCLIVTGVYVYYANTVLEPLTHEIAQIVEEAK